MYAYSASQPGAQQDYWDGYDFNTKKSNCPEPKELTYWRKHPNLHGWMERLWKNKGQPGPSLDNMFNGVELELTWEDLEALEQDILDQKLPSTWGFFFGDASDDYYKEQDLRFIREAKADLMMGLKVFYNSSW
jgi:hypothetical protein